MKNFRGLCRFIGAKNLTAIPAAVAIYLISSTLGAIVPAAAAKDDPRKLSMWTITEGKDEFGTPRTAAILNPWSDDPSTVTQPVSAALIVTCTAGNLSVALVSDIDVDGPNQDIFIRRDGGSEQKESWKVNRMLPGIWSTKEAGEFMDSLSEVNDLSIRYEDVGAKWSRTSKYKMTHLKEAKKAINSKCSW